MCQQILALSPQNEISQESAQWHFHCSTQTDRQTGDETTSYHVLCSGAYNGELSTTRLQIYITTELVFTREICLILIKLTLMSPLKTIMPCCKHKVVTTFYRTATYLNITATKLQALFDNHSEEFKVLIKVFYDDWYKIYFHYLATDTMLWWANLPVSAQNSLPQNRVKKKKNLKLHAITGRVSDHNKHREAILQKTWKTTL